MKKGLLVVVGSDQSKCHRVRFAHENIRESEVVSNLSRKFTYRYSWDIGNTHTIRELMQKKKYDLVLLAPDSRGLEPEISELVTENTELASLEGAHYKEMIQRKQAVFFS